MAKNMELVALFDVYGALLTEKQQAMFTFYYDDDLSLGEIAENEGISRQGVRDAIARAEVQLLVWEEALGFVARGRAEAQRMEKIAQKAQAIAAATKGHSSLWEIHERATEIAELTSDKG